LLTVNDGNANAAQVRFLVDGAPMPAETGNYERVVLVFDGDDEDAVQGARTQWADVKARGLAATYWQPDDTGRWQQKA
jgi:DNA polymerase-3 subunit chi